MLSFKALQPILFNKILQHFDVILKNQKQLAHQDKQFSQQKNQPLLPPCYYIFRLFNNHIIPKYQVLLKILLYIPQFSKQIEKRTPRKVLSVSIVILSN